MQKVFRPPFIWLGRLSINTVLMAILRGMISREANPLKFWVSTPVSSFAVFPVLMSF